VDLLYSQDGPAHAESLAQLSKLWKELGREDRSQEALAMLRSKYPNSPWLKSL
jgi:hypothetical protein